MFNCVGNPKLNPQANHNRQCSKKSKAAEVDGNGNVIGLVDMATGVKSATYDYNAFGETIISDGVAAEAMPFRFSTKYQDAETGFYNYGYRIYQPSTGRWLSKDSIEEQGGLNLYGFLSNSPLTGVDLLGMYHVGKAIDDGANTVVTDGLGGLIIAFGDNAKTTSPCIIDSIRVHEGVHRLQALNQNNALGYVLKNGKPSEPQPAGLALKPNTYGEQLLGEMDASERQIAFLNKILADPAVAKCKCDLGEVRRYLVFVEGYKTAHEQAFVRASRAELDGQPKDVFKRHQNTSIQIQ